jgi:1-acyl-sn-glycerol-3-phosphate acyltransferase
VRHPPVPYRRENGATTPEEPGDRMRRRIGRWVIGALRYRIVGEPPRAPAYVLVAAPHTSWLDLPLMLGIAWSSGVEPGFLAKKELFRPPFGALLRAVGAIEIDRENPGGVVADLAERAGGGAPFALVIAPEGTRGLAEGWKTGFYRIACEAGIPISLGFVDGPSRSGGFGPTLEPTGDLAADMAVIRAFYADKHGVVPDRASPVVVRAEARGTG